jgi:hypothetical protein
MGFQFNVPNLLKISLPLLIILEITKLTSYYYQFGLPIVEYLTFSDAGLLFLDEIITYLMFLIPTFYIAVCNEKEADRAIPTVMIVFVILGAVSFLNENLIFESTKIFTTIVVIAQLVVILSLRKRWVNTSWGLMTLFYAILLLATTGTGYLKANDVKNNNSYSGTRIIFDDSTVISDSTLYYIGRTSNYIFFFKKTEKIAVIYPASRVKEINFRSKKIQRGGNHPPGRPPL